MYESPFIVTQNCTVYGRLSHQSWGEEPKIESREITNIDKELPVITNVEFTTGTITFSGTDNLGIIAYNITQTSEEPQEGWTEVASIQTTLSNIKIEGLAQGSEHYIWLKDQVGNINTAQSVKLGTMPALTQQNLTFTKTPSDWTNGNVEVTISTTEKVYQLQYSQDNINWQNYTERITYETNGTIYARLTDGVNNSGIKSEVIDKIDKLLPNTPNFTVVAGSKTITITASGTDQVANTLYASSGIAKYEYSRNNSTWQTSNSFTGLSASTAYTIYVRSVDNAGNSSTVRNQSVSTTALYDKTFAYTGGVQTFKVPETANYKFQVYRCRG